MLFSYSVKEIAFKIRHKKCFLLKASHSKLSELVTDYMTSPRQNTSSDADLDVGYDETIINRGFESLWSMNSTFLLSSDFLSFVVELLPMIRESLGSIENKELKVIAFLLAVGVIVLIKIFQQNVSHLNLYQPFGFFCKTIYSFHKRDTKQYRKQIITYF